MTPHAPYGYKADGTPRKRPAPAWLNDPDKVAVAVAKRRKTAAPAVGSLLERIDRELEEQLATIDAEASELRDRLALLHAEHDRLTAARHAIRP